MSTAAEAAKTAETATEENLLTTLLDEAALGDRDADIYESAKQGISALMETLLGKGRDFGKIDRSVVDVMIAELDKRVENQVNEIMHSPDFQKLESSWRSVRYLLDRADPKENIEVHVLNATKQDLEDDFEDSPELTKSGYYRTIYSKEYGTLGGIPYAAVVTDFDFSHRFEDVQLMSKLASVGAMAHVPLIANADPQFFGGDSFDSLVKLRDLDSHFESPAYAKWRGFREQEDSRYICLAMPRFLLRQPYEPGVNTERAFHFVEDVAGKHDHYLWAPASFALGARCTESFAASGWASNIIGPESGGTVGELPTHQYEAMGDLLTKMPVEVQLTERREFELAEQGLIGLTYRKGSDSAVFFSANSVQKPRSYTSKNKDSELNYRLGTQLPYMLLACRVAHYLKTMQREKLGSYTTATELQADLQWWLSLQTTASSSPADVKEAYPFAQSSVTVSEVPGEVGWYRFSLQLVPHARYMGADFKLALVGKLDQALSK